jgi:plasmid stabilization system protein ParE
MSRRVRFTKEARVQFDTADEWWQRNRTAAPDAFWNEFIEVAERLTEMPESGAPVRMRGEPGLRRILLPTSKYHVYYEITPRLIRVRSVWSALRGSPPSISPSTRHRRS